MSDSRTVRVQGGKEHEVYPSLLDKAHHKKLEGINTELTQVPNPENDMVAIVHARVYLDGKTFDGIGDASPQNVSRNIAPHVIRMAETRAKARALRDAVNVHAAEFDGEYTQEDVEAVRSQPRGSSELAVVDGGYEDDSDEPMDNESESRKAVLDELVSNAKKLGFNNQQISKKLETQWLEANLVELEESASRMRMAVEDKEKSLEERGE